MPNQENHGQDSSLVADTNSADAEMKSDAIAGTSSTLEQTRDLLCQAEDLKGLLQQIANQIADVDKRHSISLRDMHERLEVIGARAQRVRSDVPSEFQPAFDRIGDAVALLADRITLADHERLSRREFPTENTVPKMDRAGEQLQPDTLGSQLEQELATLKTTLAAAGDAAGTSQVAQDEPSEPETVVVEKSTAETSVACDPAEPWDAASAAALADLYASGEEGLPPVPSASAQMPMDSNAATPGQSVNHIDQDWLESRFADVAARVEMSLSDVQDKFSIEELGSRFDLLEEHITDALGKAAAKPDADGLSQIEEHLKELTGHLEKTQNQLARLDNIDDHIGEVVRHISDQNDAMTALGQVKPDQDIQAIVQTVADEFAVKLAPGQPTDESAQQINGLQSMLEGYMNERREGEKNTSGALDTMQSALIHLLERVDAMEVNMADASVPQHVNGADARAAAAPGAAAPQAGVAAQPTPQEYVREAVRFKVDDAQASQSADPVSSPADLGRAADEARFMADAAADAAAGHTAPRGQAPGTNRQAPVDDVRSSPELADGPRLQDPSQAATGGNRPTTSVEPVAPGQHSERANFIAQARRAQQLAGERMDQELKDASRPDTDLRAQFNPELQDASVADAAVKKQGKGMSKPLLLACAGLAVLTMGTLLYGKISGNNQQTAGTNRQIAGPEATRSTSDAKSTSAERAADAMAESGEVPAVIIPQRGEDANGDRSNGTVPSKLTQDSSLMPAQTPAIGSPAGVTVHNSSRKLSAAALQRIIDGQTAAMSSSGNAAQGGSRDMATNAALQPPNGLVISQGQSDDVASGKAGSNRALNMPPALVGPLSLRLAAAKGDPSAEFEVAARFAEGKGIKQDYSEAVKWYQRSATRGFAPAQYRLGTLYERGMGVTTDQSRSRIWYLRAAKQGNVKAMHNLAVLSAGRVAGDPDYATAVQWFTEAAERGLADSQFNLGILYGSGLGVTADPVQSYKWFSLAAARGDKQASGRADALRRNMTPAQMTSAERLVRSWRQTPVERMVNDPHAAGRAWSSNSKRSSAG